MGSNNAAGAASALSGNALDNPTQDLIAGSKAPVVMMPVQQLPQFIQNSTAQINASESKIRPIVAQGVKECF